MPQHPPWVHTLTASPCTGSQAHWEQGYPTPSFSQRPRAEDVAVSSPLTGRAQHGLPRLSLLYHRTSKWRPGPAPAQRKLVGAVPLSPHSPSPQRYPPPSTETLPSELTTAPPHPYQARPHSAPLAFCPWSRARVVPRMRRLQLCATARERPRLQGCRHLGEGLRCGAGSILGRALLPGPLQRDRPVAAVAM